MIQHAETDLLHTCEQLDDLIHPKRLDGLKYLAPYLTAHPVHESIEVYWGHIESAEEGYKDCNPPLDLVPTLDGFMVDPSVSSLVLLGDAGLGKTLTTYLLADKWLAKWWTYWKDPKSNSKPAYLPLFVRPAISQWSHSALQKEGFKQVLKFYGLTERNVGLLLIVDGYDECQGRPEGSFPNLAEELNLPTDTHIKLLITCRPHTVPQEQLSSCFQWKGLLETRYFLLFNITQMLGYLSQQLGWNESTRADYQRKLESATTLRTVLRNPFVLHLFVQSFDNLKDLNFQQLLRWHIYESAVGHWIKTQGGLLDEAVRQLLAGPPTEGLTRSFDGFASEIAFTAFQGRDIRTAKALVEQISASPWKNIHEEVRRVGIENFV
eukprot:TRINITY_DN1373_c0_g1_i13.p1 TRINITY_DN1373_c0_g1~~TRINITY_DN1373_c0_g1_i13.p1  ORF type:complete len:379 (-),score=46.20 TRINITY_DN1373_c0_g1_i13:1672-2808(-)